MPERLQTYLNGVLVDEHLGHDLSELVEVVERATEAVDVGFAGALGGGETIATTSEQQTEGSVEDRRTEAPPRCADSLRAQP